MFESQLGLRENPFVAGHQPKFVYPSREHQEALAHLRFGIENREPFVLITGEVGTGKTTAIYDALHGWGTRAVVALITNSSLTRPELLEEIALRFGMALPPGMSKPQAMVLLERHLLAIRQRGDLAVLLLDEAQNLDRDLLEEIRLLSNLEYEGHKLLQIFLVGQPELEGKLAQPELRQLRQRISVHYRLNPLSVEETAHYIHHRVAVAGGNAHELFPPDTCAAVHTLTYGIPREINTVAGQALINAYVEDSRTVLPHHVLSVASETEFKSVIDAHGHTTQHSEMRIGSPAAAPPRAMAQPPAMAPSAPPSTAAAPQRMAPMAPQPTHASDAYAMSDPGLIDAEPTSPDWPMESAPTSSAPVLNSPAASIGFPSEVSLPPTASMPLPRMAPEPAPAPAPRMAPMPEPAPRMPEPVARNSEPVAPMRAEPAPARPEPDHAAPTTNDISMPAWLDDVIAKRSTPVPPINNMPPVPGTPASMPVPGSIAPMAANTPPPPPRRIAPHPSDSEALPPRLRDKLEMADRARTGGNSPLPWMIAAGVILAVVIAVVLAMRFGFMAPKDTHVTPAATAPTTSTPTTEPIASAPSAVTATSAPPTVTPPQATVPVATSAATTSTPVVTAPPVTHKPTAPAMLTTSTPVHSTKPAPVKPAGPKKTYGIIVGTYFDQGRALAEAQKAAGTSGVPVSTIQVAEDGATMYRAIVGHYNDRASADRAAAKLASKGDVSEANVTALGTAPH